MEIIKINSDLYVEKNNGKIVERPEKNVEYHRFFGGYAITYNGRVLKTANGEHHVYNLKSAAIKEMNHINQMTNLKALRGIINNMGLPCLRYDVYIDIMHLNTKEEIVKKFLENKGIKFNNDDNNIIISTADAKGILGLPVESFQTYEIGANSNKKISVVIE